MASLSISEVGRQAGLRPSAIRYYERLGILSPPIRVSGRRRYDTAVIYRLAVVRRAQEVGFTLEEIHQIFFGSGNSSPISGRWREVATAKLAELDARMQQIKTMKRLLQKLQTGCHCDTVERCGAGILRSRNSC
jgi:MerR family transcriptional regulator, redox-sensitive transcriptional activator SoxR